MSKWNNLENRISAVRDLVAKINKTPQEITQKDFQKNNLSGLLNHYYKNSPYLALKEARYNFEPWEMASVPQGYWKKNPDKRTRAVKWLVAKIGKRPKEIKFKDFMENNLGGLLNNYYNNSQYLALKEAGLVDFEPWEMGGIPKKYWQNLNERIRAIRWLITKIGKKPQEITKNEFIESNLGGLLDKYYNSSPYLALKETGLVDFEPWEMAGGTPKRYWQKNPDERIRAVKWLVNKTGKKSWEMIQKDFIENNLCGLLAHYYKNSPYLALKEAGYDVERKPQLNFSALLSAYIKN